MKSSSPIYRRIDTHNLSNSDNNDIGGAGAGDPILLSWMGSFAEMEKIIRHQSAAQDRDRSVLLFRE